MEYVLYAMLLILLTALFSDPLNVDWDEPDYSKEMDDDDAP